MIIRLPISRQMFQIRSLVGQPVYRVSLDFLDSDISGPVADMQHLQLLAAPHAVNEVALQQHILPTITAAAGRTSKSKHRRSIE